MSLLQNLPYSDYQRALKFTVEQCDFIASLARIRNIKFTESKNPGELLLKNLDRRGYTVQDYKAFISFRSHRLVYYKPNTKIAILIGNDKYVHLPKIATPATDCNILSSKLTSMGFTVIALKNTTAKCLRDIYSKIFNAVPEDSYCFIYYAGHGCEVNDVTCLLGVDCPSEDIHIDHCVTQEFLLNEAGSCKPDLCIVIFDMCRSNLDSQTNPSLHTHTQNQPINSKNHKNLIVCYSTQSSECAYEVLQLIDCSESIESNMTYELRTCDLANVVANGSQYANALCKHLDKDGDVDSLLDLVHEDLGKAKKQQKAIKLKFGNGKRSLHDPAIGNKDFLNKLEEIGKDFNNPNKHKDRTSKT